MAMLIDYKNNEIPMAKARRNTRYAIMTTDKNGNTQYFSGYDKKSKEPWYSSDIHRLFAYKHRANAEKALHERMNGNGEVIPVSEYSCIFIPGRLLDVEVFYFNQASSIYSNLAYIKEQLGVAVTTEILPFEEKLL